ncbi:AraC family transcriptional regulator [Brucella abortus]|nr:AraC family transcriptional regulator [Brucella abortus]
MIDRKGKPTSLKEIAYCCGFNDRTQFTKAFKARFELSPKEAHEIGAPLPQAQAAHSSCTAIFQNRLPRSPLNTRPPAQKHHPAHR